MSRYSSPPMAPLDIADRLRDHFSGQLLYVQANRRENAGAREDNRNARSALRKWREDQEARK